MKQLDGTGLKRLHRGWRRRTVSPLALVLDSVQGPYNAGSIVRTAAAYRVERVWLTGSTPDLATPAVQKAAMGTDRYLSVERARTALDAIEAERADGYMVLGLELADGAVPLWEVASRGAICVVVGNEDHGLNTVTLQACDAVAYLPLAGKVGSLNVAAAAAVALFEVRRQQWTTADDTTGDPAEDSNE